MEILASMNLTDKESKCDSKGVWKAMRKNKQARW